MTRGRKRTSPETLRLHGNFRGDRHAERDLAPEAAGIPIKPDYLDGEAAWFWDFVVNELSQNGTVARLDTSELVGAAEMWELYRKSVQSAKVNPTDKEARIAAISYFRAWESAAAKLGLNPTDRQRIKSSNKPKAGGIRTRQRTG